MAAVRGKKKELAELKKSIGLIGENKRAFARKLYGRIEFMDETLNELEQKIKDDGPIVEGVNGNGFKVMQEHPAQKSYNVMVGKYNAMVKTIIDLIPENVEEGDDLMNFIRGKS